MQDPPNNPDPKKLFIELMKLDALKDHSYRKRKYELIHDIAELKYLEAKPYFINGLSDQDPDYRFACISALVTHWRLSDESIVERLIELAMQDPEEFVREIAIDSLGNLRVERSLPLIKKIALDEREDIYTRRIAYLAILKVLNYDPKYVHELWQNIDSISVDEGLVNSAFNED